MTGCSRSSSLGSEAAGARSERKRKWSALAPAASSELPTDEHGAPVHHSLQLIVHPTSVCALRAWRSLIP
jgi:hypothetical protein